MQLSLLETEVPESYLFPEVDNEEVMDDLPHPLKDETIAASVKNSIDKEKKFLIMEELAEEGVLESLAICGMLGMMMMKHIQTRDQSVHDSTFPQPVCYKPQPCLRSFPVRPYPCLSDDENGSEQQHQSSICKYADEEQPWRTTVGLV